MRSKLSREDGEELIRLFEEEGVHPKVLGSRFGLSLAAVNYRLLRAGLDPWPGECSNKGQCPGAFSPEEDRLILELGATGLGTHKIAAQMGRAKTSVLIRMLTLEVRAEKSLEAA